jgi:hypothetical protein
MQYQGIGVSVRVSVTRVLKVLKSGTYVINPKKPAMTVRRILDVCEKKEEQSAAYLRVPPGKRENYGVCLGKKGHISCGLRGRHAFGREAVGIEGETAG